MLLTPKNYECHDFYCMKCGNRNYSLYRPRSRLHERFHRKTLYCPNCKIELNHIECSDDEEAFDFKIAFEEGAFIEEAEESIKFIEEVNSHAVY